MTHGGDVYRNKVHMDFSVSLNPLKTPAEVTEAIKRSVDLADRYPDLKQEEPKSMIADAAGMQSGNVCVGSGASELLMAAVRAADPNKAFLWEPCFYGYRHALQAVGCKTVRHVTDEKCGFAITEADIGAIEKDVDLIIVCDPLCPAGLNVDQTVLKQILNLAKGQNATAILDESFFLLSDYLAQTGCKKSDRAAGMISAYENLIVIRSLTKILAIPGVRCGYALGSRQMIGKMQKQLPEWNLSIMAQEAVKAGIGVIRDTDFLKCSGDLIRRERAYLTEGMRQMGLRVFDSMAPFVLFSGPPHLHMELQKRGILIRDCSDYMGLGRGYYRTGVKEHRENEMLIGAMKGIMDAL